MLALKLERVVVVVWTTFENSLVSVMKGEVSCCITTVPVGALGPAKFTVSA